MDIIVQTLLQDKRSNCYSVLSEFPIQDYLEWYERYGEKNSLDEQRDVVRSTSANKIRTRLIDDLTRGAVIPPIVLGLSINDSIVVDENSIEQLINRHLDEATVIDGIQRTEAIKQASFKEPNIQGTKIRIEFWISFSPINLIYRMLILNTGQMPWSVKRQLDVVYKPFIKRLTEKVEGIRTYTEKDAERRKGPGEYQVNNIIELFLAFTSRKETVDTKDKLAEDFARLELIEATATDTDSELFMKSIQLMVNLDKALSAYNGEADGNDQQFKKGLDLFTKLPAQIGFIVAISKRVLGLAGSATIEKENKNRRMDEIVSGVEKLITRLSTMDQGELRNFLAFDILNERYSSFPKIRIGEKQREFFRRSFSELIDNKFDISLHEAWVAGIS